MDVCCSGSMNVDLWCSITGWVSRVEGLVSNVEELRLRVEGVGWRFKK
jgi:hypothetical protein